MLDRISRVLLSASLLSLLGAGCLAPPPAEWDRDGDGSPQIQDCDDNDPLRGPHLSEVCDEVDNDCDGQTDEDLRGEFQEDADGDGFPGAGPIVDACLDAPPANHVPATETEDCDDTTVAAFPGRDEICDEIDNNCDGVVDDGLTFVNYYRDADEDGFGDALEVISSCDGAPPLGYVEVADDCDDDDPDSYPEATEVCDRVDNDCDGVVDDGLDRTLFGPDRDGDGFGEADGDPGELLDQCGETPEGYAPGTDDCDDADPTINPLGVEICDGADNDCDGITDGDNDLDGIDICSGDCDDTDATIRPGVPELCDGLDRDCDGVVDSDTDGDGRGPCEGDCDESDPLIVFGGPEYCNGSDDNCNTLVDEDVDGDGSEVCDDCDDADAGSFPGAIEVCGDGVDQSCDGTDTDRDVDGDGFSSAGSGCGGDDCNDLLPGVNPGIVESCDGVDNNCSCPGDTNGDGLVCAIGDEGVDEGPDADGDGSNVCFDCDDTEAAAFPDNPEICDSVDNDCNTLIDDAPDTDGDTFGPCGGDCDDGNPLVFPGALESCNTRDDDCDDVIDEDLVSPLSFLAAAPADQGLLAWPLEGGSFGFPQAVGAHPAPSFGLWWRHLAIDDLDGDGIDSLIAQSTGSDIVYRFDRTCAGDWVQTEVLELGAGDELLLTYDPNGDGLADLLVATATGQLRAWIQGADTFVPRPAGNLSGILGLAVWEIGRHPQDFTGDDIADLVACGGTGTAASTCAIYPGATDGTFDIPAGVPVSPFPYQVSGIAEGDFNGDGFADLLLGLDDDGDPGQVRILRGSAGGLLAHSEAFDVNPAAEVGSDAGGLGRLAPMSINGDPLMDVVALWDPLYLTSDRSLTTHLANFAGIFTTSLLDSINETTPDVGDPDALATPAIR